MKIGLVVYSATGNTRLVANQLKSKLEEKGDAVDFLEVNPIGDPKQPTELRFEKMHSLDGYDALVFASFVEAFTLNRCMSAYLKKMDQIADKKTAMLTTQQLPKKWMGGNQAQKKMKDLLEAKGAKVIGGEDINWKSKPDGRQGRIDAAVDSLCETIWKS